MWIEKLIDGVVELETPIGPRYLQPNFFERAYLMWTFRNFFSLPQQVLRPWERRLIERLRSENRFVAIATTVAGEAPIIGRVERRAPVQVEVEAITNPSSSMRKPVAASEVATDESEEAASA